MSTTADTLIQLAGKRFGADTAALSPDDDFFEKLGIDSLAAMGLLSEIEMHFDVEIPDYEVADVRTFAALAAIVEQRTG